MSLTEQPTIFDLDNDGTKEIIVSYGMNDFWYDDAKVHVFNHDGTYLKPFPVLLPVASMAYGPVAADIDNDGYGEIIGVGIGYNRDAVLYILEHDGRYKLIKEGLYPAYLRSDDIDDDYSFQDRMCEEGKRLNRLERDRAFHMDTPCGGV